MDIQHASIRGIFADVIKDIDMAVIVHPVTLVVALVIAVLVAVLTPILNVFKMVRMDIPATLRVME